MTECSCPLAKGTNKIQKPELWQVKNRSSAIAARNIMHFVYTQDKVIWHGCQPYAVSQLVPFAVHEALWGALADME